METIIFINVPFEEKDAAKALGAKWHREEKRWFITEDLDIADFSRWFDTMYKKGNEGVGGLYVDLVPSSCWYSNVRSMLSKGDWDTIRRKIYTAAQSKCSICGGRGPKHAVEAHERWEFSLVEGKNTQTLKRVEALCPSCHQATHYGLAQVTGNAGKAFDRLKYVNGWDDSTTKQHIDEAFSVWSERSSIRKWELDLTWLTDGFELSEESLKIIDDLKSGKIERH